MACNSWLFYWWPSELKQKQGDLIKQFFIIKRCFPLFPYLVGAAHGQEENANLPVMAHYTVSCKKFNWLFFLIFETKVLNFKNKKSPLYSVNCNCSAQNMKKKLCLLVRSILDVFTDKPIWKPIFIYAAHVNPEVPVNAFERTCWTTSNK